MGAVEILVTFAWILLNYFISRSSCDNSDPIKYSAANTSVMHDTKNGLRFAKFVQLRNLSLIVVPIKVLKTKSGNDCLLSCVANMRCVSLNLVMLPSGEYICQLLATEMFNNQEANNLIQGPYYNHFTLQVNVNCKYQPPAYQN